MVFGSDFWDLFDLFEFDGADSSRGYCAAWNCARLCKLVLSQLHNGQLCRTRGGDFKLRVQEFAPRSLTDCSRSSLWC